MPDHTTKNKASSNELNRAAQMRSQSQPTHSIHDVRISPEDLKVRITRAQRGDDRALARLYRDYSGFIFTISRGICQNDELAKDVVGTVLVKWLKNFHLFTGKYTWAVPQVEEWLRIRTTWATYSALRQRPPKTALGEFLVDITETDVPAGNDTDPEVRMLSKRISDDIDACFRGLARPDQAVMGVRFTGTTRKAMSRAILFEESEYNVREFERKGKERLQECLLAKRHSLPDFTDSSGKEPPKL